MIVGDTGITVRTEGDRVLLHKGGEVISITLKNVPTLIGVLVTVTKSAEKPAPPWESHLDIFSRHGGGVYPGDDDSGRW